MTQKLELVENIYSRNFHVIDNFLDDYSADTLRTHALQLIEENQFHEAKIGSQQNAIQNTSIRRDKIFWLDDSSEVPAVNTYFTAMKTITNTLNQHLFLGLIDFETHFAHYQPGSFYKRHVDQFNNKQDRKISCVYYLNLNWQARDGGELNLYDNNDKLLINIHPIANRLVCFTSDLPHEVCPTHKTRLSIAGWMKTRSTFFVG